MKGRAVEKDPFHNPQPQVSAVYQYEAPEELRNFDSAKGGINSQTELTDPGHRAAFEPDKQKEYDFHPTKREVTIEKPKPAPVAESPSWRPGLYGGASNVSDPKRSDPNVFHYAAPKEGRK